MNGEQKLSNLTVAVEIDRFLSGESDGGPLFHALYGDVVDEPIPERLIAVVRECCTLALEPETLPQLADAPVSAAAAS
jgi:hypothetical protein